MINECKIIKDLPSGGQKNVQLAEHPKIGLVVIKRGAIKSFTTLERIKREIELLSELKSDFYPQQYHFNIDIKTKEFEIIEDYIEGATLREAMKNFSNVEQIFSLLLSLTKGLSIIWDRNIVHRDLKPENIIIRKNGMPCIIDLGIARFLDLESLTKTISPVGPCTPIYASPEQLTNNKNVIDHRTDFFGLGIIALELFLGVHPFDPTYLENHFSIVENILQNKYLVETKQVKRDDRMVELASRTLQPQPFNRFRNYQLLQSFLEKHLQK
ncbi:MAG TPA: serine/threonine-protein kinase [Chitinophagaceae bacterium]|jgi:serine/threonine protein kinase|nr:serine/threonine-protein kinase [Chitinophagaceae bacterium]